jgi:hypothetical protein
MADGWELWEQDESSVCERCETASGDIHCSCGARFCEACFNNKHLVRNPKHRRGGSSRTDRAWAWISGKALSLSGLNSWAPHFEKDEASKWFGLHIQKTGNDRVTRLVETPRFASLIEASVHHRPDSPRRQFPSITSFIGETGAGKSTPSKPPPLICVYAQADDGYRGP